MPSSHLKYSGDSGVLATARHWPETGLPPFANLFLQNQRDLARTQDAGAAASSNLFPFPAPLADGVTPPGPPSSSPGTRQLDGYTFHDATPHPVQRLTATTILAQSSNIGTSFIATALGEQRLLRQVHQLRFGSPTGLDFPGESSGLLVGPTQWAPTDFVSLAIGQVDAVNAVGCVNVYIPARLYDPLHSAADFQKGWHCLSGTWALAYIRIRQNAAGNSFRTNDFQRMGAGFDLARAGDQHEGQMVGDGNVADMHGAVCAFHAGDRAAKAAPVKRPPPSSTPSPGPHIYAMEAGHD